MLLIDCPWCGERAETEFSYGGEAGIVRPKEPDALSDCLLYTSDAADES